MCSAPKPKMPAPPPPPAPPPVASGDLKIKALKEKKKSLRNKRKTGKQALRKDLKLNIGTDSSATKKSGGLNIPI